MKIKQLIKSFEEINNNLKNINESLKENKKRTELAIDSNFATMSSLNSCINNIESSVYTKEETIQTINKEYEYIENLKKCKEKNKALLDLIETYCKFDNKYQIVDLFEQIDNEYIVEKLERNK